ncbi:MAG TPA: TetR/AcrR family transcriptional regulator [Ktedonobacterales bacterium]|nr:TetR/AcrR family transcriptional regulator [Ktedonobacterales bacterium]
MPKQGGSDEYQRIIDLLWGVEGEPRRGPKPSLSIERIIQVAVTIADGDGLEAVSMQRVARECGVSTMALYRYVPGKAELVALMLDLGLGAPPRLDDLPGGWRPRLVVWAARLRAIFLAHPWSLAATAPPRLMGPNELAWLEAAVAALAETGLRADERVQAVLTVLLHVRGMAYYAADRAARQRQGDAGWDGALAGLLRTHATRLPTLAAAAAAGAFASPAGDDQDDGLALVLDGIGQRAAERTAARVDA